MKAKFIRKYYGKGYERNCVYLDYEYRGYTYTIDINNTKGNEPLSWQHRNAQGRIDRLIELEESKSNKESHPFDIDEVFNMLGWDD